MGAMNCRNCGKNVNDHTPEEQGACADINMAKDRAGRNPNCRMCGRPKNVHTIAQLSECERSSN